MNNRSRVVHDLFLVFIWISYIGYSNSKSASECADLGFVKSNVTCVICDLLEQFDLPAMKDDCLNCCQLADFERKVKKYPKAQLEMCTCKFSAFPQIQAFIQSDRPSRFPNLQVRHLHGANPVIKLLDERDSIKEILAIDKWSTDAIEEFFKFYLEPASDSRDYLRTNEL